MANAEDHDRPSWLLVAGFVASVIAALAAYAGWMWLLLRLPP
jgi:hypothetical protein